MICHPGGRANRPHSWVGTEAKWTAFLRLDCRPLSGKTMSPWRGECTVKSGGRVGQEPRSTLGNCLVLQSTQKFIPVLVLAGHTYAMRTQRTVAILASLLSEKFPCDSNVLESNCFLSDSSKILVQLLRCKHALGKLHKDRNGVSFESLKNYVAFFSTSRITERRCCYTQYMAT
jgi:hypothetical protein